MDALRDVLVKENASPLELAVVLQAGMDATTAQKAARELAALETALLDQKNIIEHFWRLLGVGTSTEAFQKINALTDLLANIQECRKLGDFMLRKQINDALWQYEEQMKGV